MNSTAAVFATTHWSMVLAAGQSDDAQASAALEQLCRTYRYPLYAYLRRRGYSSEDAQDLTQGFFLQLLEKKSFARADPSRGRFRSYLLAGLNYFVPDEHTRAVAQKRGGGRPILSLDAEAAAERYRLEAVDERSPDKLFERAWALTLLDQVLARLEHVGTRRIQRSLGHHLRHLWLDGSHPILRYRVRSTRRVRADESGLEPND
jgi:DNA-directed RNA polymerase specialized sigma24 family protein